MTGEMIEDLAMLMAEDDNVATALENLDAGQTVPAGPAGSLDLREDIEFGHKFALKETDVEEEVYKYGEVIGRAIETIEAGEWVHTHNVESTRGRGDVPEEESAGNEDRQTETEGEK